MYESWLFPFTEQGIDRRSPHALFLDSFQVTDTIAGFNCDGKWLEGNALKKRGSATAIVQFRAHGKISFINFLTPCLRILV